MRAPHRGRVIGKLRGAVRESAVREVISRWRAWDGSKADFCRREGISPISLGRWLAEFPAPRAGAALAPPRFVEAVLDDLAPQPFEVLLPTGARVRVPPGFDETELRRLLTVVVLC